MLGVHTKSYQESYLKFSSMFLEVMVVSTDVERERGVHGAELLHLGLHEAVPAAHHRHGLRLPVWREHPGILAPGNPTTIKHSEADAHKSRHAQNTQTE